MAYLKPIKKTYKEHITYHYYSRVLNVHWTKGYKMVSLNTTDINEARKRHQEVEDNEGAVKDGNDVQWTWRNPQNRGRTRIATKRLGQVIDEWLEIKKINVRVETYRRYIISLKAFTNVIGRTSPLSNINNKSIEDFKKFYTNKHTKNGININLRGIKCFLLWALDEEHIKKMPKIHMMQTNKSKPKILNEGQWKAIMKADFGWNEEVTKEWKDIFRVYRQTGIRLSEGILGELVGHFLIVKAEDSKTKMEREIPLTEYQVRIIQKMQVSRDEHLAKGSSMQTFKGKFSKMFVRACKSVGIYESKVTTFHMLRHTFAVRKYLQTRDIYQVCKELGHTSIKTTEIYTQFSFARLEQDFPTLSLQLRNTPKKDDLETNKRETINYQFLTSPLIN